MSLQDFTYEVEYLVLQAYGLTTWYTISAEDLSDGHTEGLSPDEYFETVVQYEVEGA